MLASQTLGIAWAIHHDVVQVRLLQQADVSIHGSQAIARVPRLHSAVLDWRPAAPVARDWLGVQRGYNVEALCEAKQEVAAQPQLIPQLYTPTGPQRVGPLPWDCVCFESCSAQNPV